MSELQVKVILNDDIRRVSVKKTVSFDELVTLICKLFNLSKDSIKIEYEDDENDWIVASSDLELEEAKRTSTLKTKNILKLRLNANVAKTPKAEATFEDCLSDIIKQVCQSIPAIQAYLPLISQFIREIKDKKHHHHCHRKQAVHKHVQCDGCGKFPIIGMRYNCKNCSDFDFCSDCYGKVQHDASHSFEEISRPIKFKHCKKEQQVVATDSVNAAEQPITTSTTTKVKLSDEVKTDGKLHAIFVEDVTIEDQTEVQPGTSFMKIWKMKNNGTLPFPEITRLGFIGGDALDGPALEGASVPCVPVGDEVQIEINLVAPKQSGRYIGHWRLMDAKGNYFGHRIWVDIVVPPAQNSVPLTTQNFFPLTTLQPSKPAPLTASFMKVDIPKPSEPKDEIKPIETKVDEIKPEEKEDSIEEVRSEKSDDENEYVKVDRSQFNTGAKLTVEVNSPVAEVKEPVKPIDTKPIEIKPIETKSIETKPVETKPVETKPVETKPIETKPVETKPIEIKPVETKPIEIKPVETKPIEIKPVDTKIEIKAINIKPVETKPVETKHIEIKPVDTKPIEIKPVETKPVEIKPVESVVKIVDDKKEAPKGDINWTTALTKLSEMGFKDVKQNIAILRKHRGDIEKAILELIRSR
jgi:hypothetical protein